MNVKPPNSMSMNYSVNLSNLEYASYNLFNKLFYNELILAYF